MNTFSNRKYAYPFTVCILFLLIIISLVVNRIEKKKETLSRTGFLLDTVISITLYDHQDEAILDRAFRLCADYDRMFSPTDPKSEVYRLNHRPAGQNRVTADPEVLSVIREGFRFSALTDGAFDLTVAPLSELWDFRSGKNELPDPAALREALSHVGWERVAVEGSDLLFPDDGAKIDPGAIAKGYIADRLKEQLESEGVESAIINLGGNILCVGSKYGNEPFEIAIRKPEENSNEVVRTLEIDGLSVVTSGVYERHFVLDGVNYHHILDPATGMPCRSGLSSVTIVGPSSMICDALSTSVFSLGEEKGSALLQTMEGYEGWMIREDGTLVGPVCKEQQRT